jgi:hypothetical protein
MKLNEIPKPYMLEKKWCIFVCFFKIIYDETIIRKGYAGISSIREIDDEVLLLNAAYREGFIRACLINNVPLGGN